MARPYLTVGLAAAVITLIADQAVKWWFLVPLDIAARGPMRVTSFFEIVLVWNRGISYGLFQQDGQAGRFFLIAVSAIAAILMLIWLLRVRAMLPALSLGLVAGGALANAIDRLLRGAVVDLFHFYVGDFSWYVFNLADAAIVAGVAGLLYDSFRAGHNGAKNSAENASQQDGPDGTDAKS